MRLSKRSCRSTAWRSSLERDDREPQGERENEQQRARHDASASVRTKSTICHRSTRPWRTRTSWRPRRAPFHEFPAMDPSPIDVPEETVVEDLADALTPVETLETSRNPFTRNQSPRNQSPKESIPQGVNQRSTRSSQPNPPTSPLIRTWSILRSRPSTSRWRRPSKSPPPRPNHSSNHNRLSPSLRRFQRPSPEPEAEPERTRRLRADESASNRSPPVRGRTVRSTTSGQKTPPPPAPPPEPARPANPSEVARIRRSAPRSSNRLFQFISRLRRPHHHRRCARRRCQQSRRSCQRPLARCLNPSIRLRS